MQRLLISGAGGFLGSHLWPRLSPLFHLIGADLPGAKSQHAGEWITLSSPEDLAEVVRRTRPDALVHAAFVNRKPQDWGEGRYLETVVAVNLPLFEVCAKLGIRTLLVSSSAVYGNAEGRASIDESTPRLPISLYGVAKVLQEMLAEYQAAAGGLQLTIARLFNLVGPGQPKGMLLPDWVSQVRQIESGGEPVLRVRHQDTRRDFIDVRDAAEAIARLIEDFRSGEVVNVASGRAVSLREISSFLQTLCSVPYQVSERESTPLGTDITSQQGNTDRLQRQWGWEPRIDWKRSVLDLWESFGPCD